MKKILILLVLTAGCVYAEDVYVEDWSSLFGGAAAQPQAQAPAAQPGFFESISIAVKMAQDLEIKALVEAKMEEYKDLGFFEKMSKISNDPQLQALIEAKASGKRAIITQPSGSQQPVAKPQAGFDWGSLFGGSQQQAPQQQPQQNGVDWSRALGSLFGGSQQQQAPQQQPQQESGAGQALLKWLLDQAKAAPAA